MQEIAREMHFSETAFVKAGAPGDTVFQVRIFTPEHEVPFAGHPLLGTAFVIRQEILRDLAGDLTLSLRTGSIQVSFRPDDSGLINAWMIQNKPEYSRHFSPSELAAVLSLPDEAIDTRFPVQEISTGLPFIIVPLISREAVKSARINREAYNNLISRTSAKAVYIFCSEPYHQENTLNARMFGDYYGVPEDPATGSAAGCLAAYLFNTRYYPSLPPEIRIEQGYEINRPSLLKCRVRAEQDCIRIEVGGSVVPIARGEFL
jgi:trans-2,3-dihydro-3-hydroxyanthranilate isomerase